MWIIARGVWSRSWYSVKWSRVQYQHVDHTSSAIIHVLYKWKQCFNWFVAQLIQLAFEFCVSLASHWRPDPVSCFCHVRCSWAWILCCFYLYLFGATDSEHSTDCRGSIIRVWVHLQAHVLASYSYKRILWRCRGYIVYREEPLDYGRFEEPPKEAQLSCWRPKQPLTEVKNLKYFASPAGPASCYQVRYLAQLLLARLSVAMCTFLYTCRINASSDRKCPTPLYTNWHLYLYGHRSSVCNASCS